MSDLIATQRYVESFPLAELKPHPKNPRLHDEQSIEESIEENQFAGAIYAQDGTNYVLSGHGRINVLQAMNVERAPVIFIECDAERAEAYMLAFNRVGEKSAYDKQILAELLTARAETGTLLGTGYDADAVDDLLSSQYEPLPEAEFEGGYAENEHQVAQRGTREAVTKAARGLREMVLVYETDRFDEVTAAIKVIEEFHSTSDTSSSVAIGLIMYARELEKEAP